MAEGKKRAALLIDGPNIFPFNYGEMKNVLSSYDVLIKRVYLNSQIIEYFRTNESRDIVGSLQNSGFEAILTGHLNDVDSYLMRDGIKVICERSDIEIIALSSGDTDYFPLIIEAKEKGRHTILITPKDHRGVSSALKNLVHEHIEINPFIVL